MFVFGIETEIFWTVFCSIVNLAFMTSHNLLFFSLYKTYKKRFRFSVVFPRKIVQILNFKVEYLKNGSADFNDFGLRFCRILNGLSVEINLLGLASGLQFSFKVTVSIGAL